MKVPTALEARVTLFKQEISRLLVDVWQIDQTKNYQNFLLFKNRIANLRNEEIINNTLGGHIVFGWIPQDFERSPILVQRSLEQ